MRTSFPTSSRTIPSAPYDTELVGRIPLISFMTVAEIERWVLQYRWGDQRIQTLRPDSCR